MPNKKEKIVIVGGGCAGLAAAYTVSKHAENVKEIILVESSDKLGGHAYTTKTPSGENVDMGFMVLNDMTYPNLLRIFSEIGAEVEDSDMSLSVHNGKDFSWSFQETTAWALRSIVQPRMWKLVFSYRAFVKKAVEILSEGTAISPK